MADILLGVGDTPGRTLALLALLQHQASWTGVELAARLGVTDRTVRRDVDRLRELGYPVEAAPGTSGGYQLGRGGHLPPPCSSGTRRPWPSPSGFGLRSTEASAASKRRPSRYSPGSTPSSPSISRPA